MKRTAWEALCAHYCKTYGIAGVDLFGADAQARKCYRARGPGRPALRYPGLIVSQTLPFLLLASQRVTHMTIDQVAKCLQLDEWETLEAAAIAESRLATDPDFAATFEAFLDALNGERREQARTVQEHVAMTYEEIAAELGLARQRVQQIEKEALQKLRDNPQVMAALMEAM